MSPYKTPLIILTLICLILTVSVSVNSLTTDFDPSILGLGLGLTTIGSRCEGTVGECMVEPEDEFDMGSDIHRRILAQTRYISYAALNRNRVPCSKRGASYYNCRPGAQANPYRRGCTAISRCRRS